MSVNRRCLYCDVPFQTSKSRRVFCCDGCLSDFWRDFGRDCYYCGEQGGTEDHVLPQSYGDGTGDVLPACMECNGLLANCKPTSHINRMKKLLDLLTDKYAVNISATPWDQTELAELSPNGNLHRDVELIEYRRRRAVSRINFLWERIQQMVQLQEDLEEVGTEVEDFDPDPRKSLTKES